MAKKGNKKRYCFSLKKKNILKKNDIANNNSKELKEPDKRFEGFIEPDINLQNLLDLLSYNIYHKACCEVISADVAGNGFTIVSSVNQPNEFEKEGLEYFFEKIRLTSLIRKLEYDLEALGFGLIEICRENGYDSDIVELNHVNPFYFRLHNDRIRVKQALLGKERWFVLKGENYDEYGRRFDVNCNTGKISYDPLPEEERANELLWFHRYSPNGSPYGFCSAVPAVLCITSDHAREEYNRNFFNNYGMPSFAITLTGNFDSESTDQLADEIKGALENIVDEPFSSLVLQVPSETDDGKVDINIQPLSQAPSEASFTVFRTQNRDDIISAHRVDPSRLSIGEAGALNGTNSIQLDSAYWISVIIPYRKQIIDELNSIIVNDFGLSDWRLEILDEAEGLKQKNIENVIQLVNSGIMTINEAREYFSNQYNIDPVEDEVADELCWNGRPLRGLSESNFSDDDVDFVFDSKDEL